MLDPIAEDVRSSMEKKEDAVLRMDIYIASREMGPEKMQDRIQMIFPRGTGWGPMLSGTGNTKPLVGYWTQLPESVRLSVGEIEDKVPCRDTYHFEGNWVGKIQNLGYRAH
jgi:hypothetical protein